MVQRTYRLAHAVKVRDEDFGLLFYLCKTTGLVFINSGQLLKADALIKGGTVRELLEESGAAMEQPEHVQDRIIALEQLLGKLVKRGLVNAQG